VIETLVVDDDFRVARLHADFVAAVDGFTLAGIAHTAAEAYEFVRVSHPDLVLLDLYLPDEHGLELMRRLADVDPPAPDVMVITAARDLTQVRTAMRQGAAYYLVKPFRFAELSNRLGAYRDLRRRLSELDRGPVEADQQDVDGLYQLLHAGASTQPPKGQSATTMQLVKDLVRSRTDVSAAEVAAEQGISRPTAQRYLAALARRGVVDLRLRYGSTGRPEHRYSSARTRG
jgi:response regulator of citrate/malate metabolism